MIITYFGIIVFQLVERIAIILSEVKKYVADMLGFSYPELHTRHEVHDKPYLRCKYFYKALKNSRRMNPQNLKHCRYGGLKQNIKIISGG